MPRPSARSLPNRSMLELLAKSQWRTMTSASWAAAGGEGGFRDGETLLGQLVAEEAGDRSRHPR